VRRMGFSHHPGLLPFVTIRRGDWANRLTVGENIEIHGEHGCDMPPTAAKVIAVEDYPHPAPPHLAAVYAGKRLCAVSLTVTDDPWRKVGESWLKSF